MKMICPKSEGADDQKTVSMAVPMMQLLDVLLDLIAQPVSL